MKKSHFIPTAVEVENQIYVKLPYIFCMEYIEVNIKCIEILLFVLPNHLTHDINRLKTVHAACVSLLSSLKYTNEHPEHKNTTVPNKYITILPQHIEKEGSIILTPQLFRSFEVMFTKFPSAIDIISNDTFEKPDVITSELLHNCLLYDMAGNTSSDVVGFIEVELLKLEMGLQTEN